MADRPAWEPPWSGPEAPQLLGALDRQRATFRWKADGLTAAQLGQRLGPSALTLGSLLGHLTWVESVSLPRRLTGEVVAADPLPGKGFEVVVDDPAALYEGYDAAVRASRQRIAEVVARDGLDAPIAVSRAWGTDVSVRRLLTDVLEELGRHTGHADLLREAVDGRVGEDPPEDWVLPWA